MNEPDEFYVLSEGAPLRLAAASAPPACIVWVGGQGNPGSRVCGHAEAEHVTFVVAGIPSDPDAGKRVHQCLSCKREGLPKRPGPGFTMWSGWDHAYIDHMPPPRPPAVGQHGEQEGAAA